MSNQDKFNLENQNEVPVDYNFLTNTSMGMIPVLNRHPTNSQNLPFCGIINSDTSNRQTDATSSRIGNIFLPNIGSSQFPADSGFIERAARFSCFGAAAGDFGDMMNPFSVPQSSNPYSRGATLVHDNPGLVDHEVNEGNLAYNEQKNDSFVRSLDEAKESGEVQFSSDGQEDQSLLKKSQNSNKRKINGQDAQTGEVKCSLEPTIEAENGGEDPLKNNRQSGENGVDSVKRDYIHIRARRGQATNSHSLAERVRREKIGERMKFLQDLVPGCSKVTGKAVMLDEIINYVQSLQRQVEFLSMKLSTVNTTRTDIHFEGLLAKDILESQAGSSSIHRIQYNHHQLHPSQAGMIHSIGNYSDVPRRASDGYKEPTSQALSNEWENELHNVMQLMGYNPDAQDLSGSVLSGRSKDEA